ncbi:ABC transporter permease [Streptomyces sp. NPDC002215]|uniref:ABC transporter permease n=1 Tax=Streptomyces sp. NPDC002215 TaxID=3154412 RepID=UPI00332ABEFE
MTSSVPQPAADDGPDPAAPAAGRAKKAPPVAVKYLILGFFPLAMVVSLVGIMLSGMHKPVPHDIPVAVVASTAPQAEQAAQGLEKALGDSFDIRPLASTDRARTLVHDRDLAGAYVLPKDGARQALLYTAGGAGIGQQMAVEQTFTQLAAQQQIELETEDLAPLHSHDSMGLVALYMGLGYSMAGFLVVTVMSVAAPELMRLRKFLPVLAGWASFMSVCIWLLTGPVIGAVHGHAWPIIGLGAAMIFAVSLVTTVFARFLGPLALIPVVTLTMFLGVPSSNGGMSTYMVPGFFHTLHGVLPLPANVESVRAVLYFGGDGVSGHLATLGVWAGAALLLNVVIELFKHRRSGDKNLEAIDHMFDAEHVHEIPDAVRTAN